MVNKSKIIVSLDFAKAESALPLLEELDPFKCRVKVGKELFTSAGPRFIEELVKRDFDVFLDLKYHDIPNTVASACRVATDLGVWMLNVHASGGNRMLAAAREEIDRHSHQPLLIAVTVLTSLSDEDMHKIGFSLTVREQVLRLAAMARSEGLDGIVCSANEAQALRAELGDKFLLVTPGIRPEGSGSDDQRRVMTPASAITAGSDYLVIGRPITKASNPLQALLEISSEIEGLPE